MGKQVMRDGDIEALRNRAKDEGRPIRSTTITRGNDHQHYRVTRNGRVRTTEIQND
jgi:hypothetical protein